MTHEQRQKLEALAEAARPHSERDGGNDWGSDRQIEAENAFHIYASDNLGIDTEDMATAKATSEDMISEVLRRAEMKFLCDELNAYCTANNLPHLSADEILNELNSTEPRNEAHCEWIADFIERWEAWEAWKEWQPRS